MMERLDYDAARALLTERMKPGAVFTRSFTADELRRECEAGTLCAETFPGGALLARRREKHQILSLLLDRGAAIPNPDFDRPTVLELAFREKDASLRALLPELETRGFAPLLRRVRLTRPAGEAAGTALPPAGEDAPGNALALLRTCFDPLTGCLPTAPELAEDAAAGRLLFTGSAVLRFSDGAAREIRQLAVAPDARGHGAGSALLDAFLSAYGGRRVTVWTAETNAAALRLYESRGFAPDGWRSEVLLWQPPALTLAPAPETILTKEDIIMREKLLDLLCECCPGVDFENETALIDDGLLESLDIVTIASALVGEFDVQLSVDDLVPENFNSLDALLGLIRSKQ